MKIGLEFPESPNTNKVEPLEMNSGSVVSDLQVMKCGPGWTTGTLTVTCPARKSTFSGSRSVSEI